jgi:chemotaxis protein methyltransferase CheR
LIVSVDRRVAFEPAGEAPQGPTPLAPPMTPAVFRGFAELVYAETGIHLAPAKQALLVARLGKRMRALDLTRWRDYLDLVRSDAREKVQCINSITTHETHFFREPNHFELLRTSVIPALRDSAAAGLRTKHLRVWSAGCSTGEEPYSLAMLFLDLLGDWHIDILATDLSTRVVESARTGHWPLRKSSEIPREYLRRFMLRGQGAQTGVMSAGEEIRSVVRFDALNLNDARYAAPSNLDLIFCRNVLIYFDAASKRRAIARFVQHLAPTGLLFVGHSESLNGISDALRAVRPTVYALKENQRAQ